MKALSASIVALVMAAAPIVCSPAGSDKQLQNVAGTVTYGASKTPTTQLAKNGQIALNDKDWAVTAANSKALITLPDSSVITMGQSSSVQMQSFDNSGVATAKFFVVGKVRFQVNHPTGAQANYTFQTPTGQIAVRGTIGDIAALTNSAGAPAGLQVNVYALTSANLPVQVTLVNGQIFTLAAGQSLVVSAAATGALVGSVGAVSNSTFAPFTQLGAPANAGSLGITTTTTTTAAAGSAGAASGAAGATTAATTTAVAAGTVGAVAATTVITQSQATTAPSATPSPSPSPTATPTIAPTATPTPTPAPTPTPTPVPTPTPTPTPSSTSVPIVIQHVTPPPAPTMAPPGPIMPHVPLPPRNPPGGRPSPHP